MGRHENRAISTAIGSVPSAVVPTLSAKAHPKHSDD
jgi:hypothetical protein